MTSSSASRSIASAAIVAASRTHAEREWQVAFGGVDLQVDDVPILVAAACGRCRCHCGRPSCQRRLEGPAAAIEGVERSKMRPRDERNVCTRGHRRGVAGILGRRYGLLREHLASSPALFCCRRGGHDGALLEIGLGIGCLESLRFTPFLLGQAVELSHRPLAKTVALAGGVTR
jgi:hypothetical protein